MRRSQQWFGAHVFCDTLNERRTEFAPFEDLDILLDVARARPLKRHNELEENLRFGLRLRHCVGLALLEVPADTILLLNREA
jgi:hypothetical protein